MSVLAPAQRGFTLLEMIAVVVIIGLLGAVLLPRFVNLTEAAEQAQISAVLGGLRSGQQQVMASYYAQGALGSRAAGNRTVTIDGIAVRFNNGQIRTTLNSNHVPSVPQNRNAAHTRLFFLFLQSAPGDIVLRNSSAAGWVMLGNNAACAAGANPRCCWEYAVVGYALLALRIFQLPVSLFKTR